MGSVWIEHKGRRIFYQDFSKNFYNSDAVRAELNEVQKVVSALTKDSGFDDIESAKNWLVED